MRLVRCLRARLHDDQSGFTLIEVLVSAAMLVLVSVGVLKTLDAAAGRSGEQKSQSVGAALAQQDQERLRAYRAQELNNYTETRTKTVGGQDYKIISRTDWVSDQSGTRACGGGARADYIRISSTVVWISPDDSETGDHRRVSLTSIVAPRVGSFGDEGSLSIEVIDRNGTGRPNVPVSVSGPKDLSGTTDQNGCLFFGYLPQGNYTVDVSVAGLIDVNGNANVSRPFGVNDGSVTSAVIELDQAATLNVNFKTRKVNTVVNGQKAHDVSIGHPGLLSPNWRAIPSSGGNAPQASYTIPNLFPFTSGYSVYSGNCPGASPSFYGLSWASPHSFVTLNPAGNQTITVHEPAVRLSPGGSGATVWPGSPASVPNGAFVLLKPEATAPNGPNAGSPTYCSDSLSFWTAKDGSSGTGAWLANFYDNADFGIPVGAYDMCIVWPVSPPASVRYLAVNNNAALQPLNEGPNDPSTSITVAKPTSTTSCL